MLVCAFNFHGVLLNSVLGWESYIKDGFMISIFILVLKFLLLKKLISNVNKFSEVTHKENWHHIKMYRFV
jgi:hypothetical protein